MAAVNASMESDHRIITVAQLDPDLDSPGWSDLHQVATIANVSRVEKRDEGAQVVVQGVERIELKSLVQEEKWLTGSFKKLPDVVIPTNPPVAEVEALHRENLRIAHAASRYFAS